MPELVTIPISVAELVISYDRPLIRIWNDRAGIVQALFDALRPWGITIDDLEFNSTGKTSEQGFTLKLPTTRMSIFFGPTRCKFTRDEADWDMAEQSILIVSSVVRTIEEAAQVSMGDMKAAVYLHIQPRSTQFMEILGQFVPPRLSGLESGPILVMATVARWGRRKITIDGSAAVANGIYLKLERDFEAGTSFSDVAARLKKDEEELFTILGVQEDRS